MAPALYTNICSTCIQILGDISAWRPKLCFSEVRKHVVKLKSLYSPTSFFTIKVKFDKIQFEDFCTYRPIFLWLKYILFTSKRFLGFSILHLDNHMCYEENENTGKGDISYAKYEIFLKIRLQLANADPVLWRRHVCIIIKKIEIGSIMSQLNPELWKTGVLP